MPAMSGSFLGSVRVQTAVALTDQSNHELNLAEIGGTQKCVWQVILAHFGSLLWPTLRNDGFRPGRKAGLA